jgi:hypothetical protein
LPVAFEAPAKVRFEVVPDDFRPVLAAQPDQRLTLLDGRVRVVYDHGVPCLQGGFDQLRLPPVSVFVVAKQILADVLVGRREPGVEECTLPRRLQADEKDHVLGRVGSQDRSRCPRSVTADEADATVP